MQTDTRRVARCIQCSKPVRLNPNEETTYESAGGIRCNTCCENVNIGKGPDNSKAFWSCMHSNGALHLALPTCNKAIIKEHTAKYKCGKCTTCGTPEKWHSEHPKVRKRCHVCDNYQAREL